MFCGLVTIFKMKLFKLLFLIFALCFISTNSEIVRHYINDEYFFGHQLTLT